MARRRVPARGAERHPGRACPAGSSTTRRRRRSSSSSAAGRATPPGFCDPAIDARIDAAQALQGRDPAAADAAWAALDRELTDRAAWIPYANPRDVRLVSERVGNVVHHPVWGLALDQTWVR